MTRDESGLLWALVYCHARQESIARMNLEEQGYNVLWLHFPTTISHAGQKRALLQSYYPGYLYAGADESRNFGAATYTRGVSSLVHAGDELILVPPKIMAQERARCLNADGLVETPVDEAWIGRRRLKYLPGATVRTMDAWSAYIALVASDDGKAIGLWREAFGRKWIAFYTPEEVVPA